MPVSLRRLLIYNTTISIFFSIPLLWLFDEVPGVTEGMVLDKAILNAIVVSVQILNPPFPSPFSRFFLYLLIVIHFRES
jgi:hypothetical protein